jgi:hypothetical protein
VNSHEADADYEDDPIALAIEADVVMDGVPGVLIDGQFYPRVQCCRNGTRREKV